MLTKTLIRKAQSGILFAEFDDKWGNRAKQVYEKNKNSEVWKQIAGDDDIITMDELKQWLAQQGLESDGKIGKNTLRKLGFNSNHAWIPRDINRPQLVYTSRLDIPEEELKTKHPEKWKQVKHERALAALVPIKVANNINLISNKDTDKYAYGEDQRGDAVSVNLSQYERNQNKIKGLKDTLQGMINSGLSTESPEYQEVYNKLLDLEENKFDHISTVMDEVVVRANPIYAADKGTDGALVAREGWIPVETSEGNPYAGRVFKKTSGPDQWYITNGRSWIMGTSNDSRVLTDDYKDATTAAWDTQRKDALLHDAYMQAYDDVANTEKTQRVNNNWNPNTGEYGISTEDLINSMNNGKRAFINGASVIANGGNHAIMGGVKAAFDDDYSLTDYANGFLGNPKNNIVGVGDAFDVENPYLRTGLNFINPTSVATGAASYLASRPDLALKYNKLPDMKLTHKVPNSNGKVVGGVYRGGVHNATKYRGDVIPVSTGGTHTERIIIPRSEMYYQSVPGVDGTPVLMTGVNLPYEQIQQRSWTPQYDGTETVTYNPELQRRLETGRYAESNFDIIPTDENTVGGNFKWNGTNGRTIITMPGTGKRKRKTSGKPSKN